MMIFYKAILFCSLFPLSLFCGLKEDLNKFLDELEDSSNTTSAQVYQGQKAGYATGGGLTVRTASKRVKPVIITMPNFDVGCGGIDLHTGAFSFISDQEIVETLKSIGTSSAGYAFMLSLETVSPQIANTIKQMQSWANTINAMNVNSCEVATQLVGSVWPKDSVASEHICKSIATHSGGMKDRVSNRHQCHLEGEREKTINDAQTVAVQSIKQAGFSTRQGLDSCITMIAHTRIDQKQPSLSITYPKFTTKKRKLFYHENLKIFA